MLSGLAFLAGISMIAADKSMAAATKRNYEARIAAEKKRLAEHDFCPRQTTYRVCEEILVHNGCAADLWKIMSIIIKEYATGDPRNAAACVIAEWYITRLTGQEFDWFKPPLVGVPVSVANFKRTHNMEDFIDPEEEIIINTEFVFDPARTNRVYNNSILGQRHKYESKKWPLLQPYYVLGVKNYQKDNELSHSLFEASEKYGSYGENLPPEVKELCREKYVELQYKWW